MTTRTITLHAFTSAKGGVGKSTLAVACAKLLAARGRGCVLIDADLTGTSLADGLRLCAPKVATRDDGLPDFSAEPTHSYWSRQETEQLCDKRELLDWHDYPPEPPFFSDILIRGDLDEECRVDALLWRHETDDGVRYLPSSAFDRDISMATGWLYREEAFDWLQRFMWMLDGMSRQMKTLRDVVIDLPPGLFAGGFTHETLVLLSLLERKLPFPEGFPAWHQGAMEWRGNPFLVTTPDMNDLAAALRYKAQHKSQLQELKLILNRASESRKLRIRDRLRQRYGQELGVDELMLSGVDELSMLREIFLEGDLPPGQDVTRLGELLRLEEE